MYFKNKEKIEITNPEILAAIEKITTENKETFEKLLAINPDRLYNRQIMFYDFEVFEEDWLVVFISSRGEFRIVHNSPGQLADVWLKHPHDIYTGFNNTKYDALVFKAIICGENPKKINDLIINDHSDKVFEILDFYKETIFKYELHNMINFDCKAKPEDALKQMEAYMGLSIVETSVPFDIDRELTHEELISTAEYCCWDVINTMKVFLADTVRFDAMMRVVREFDLHDRNIGKTYAKVAATVLVPGKYLDDIVVHRDELEFFDCIPKNIELDKYEGVRGWFYSLKETAQRDYVFDETDILPREQKYQAEHRQLVHNLTHVKGPKSWKKRTITVPVHDIPVTFAFGGLHGVPEVRGKCEGNIYHCDITSMYPSIIIKYGLMSRNCPSPAMFKRIYDKRVKYKEEGDKGRAGAFKVIINSVYGCFKSKYSTLYDPKYQMAIAVTGQLLLLDFINTLEEGGLEFELLNANTDGIFIRLPEDKTSKLLLDQLTERWSERTGLQFCNDPVKFLFQKDVNNYICIFSNGAVERKGATVKEKTILDNNLPIVNEALVQAILNDVPVRETIMNCNDYTQFQQVYKVSQSSYNYAVHDGEILDTRVNRVFASKDENKGPLMKNKKATGENERYTNCPEHCYVENNEVAGVEIPDELDREWYVEFAEKKLAEYTATKKSRKSSTNVISLEMLNEMYPPVYLNKPLPEPVEEFEDDEEEEEVVIVKRVVVPKEVPTTADELNQFIDKMGTAERGKVILMIMDYMKEHGQTHISQLKQNDFDEIHSIVSRAYS